MEPNITILDESYIFWHIMLGSLSSQIKFSRVTFIMTSLVGSQFYDGLNEKESLLI